jgi:UDP-N-acetylmuramyl tripeptide synthase
MPAHENDAGALGNRREHLAGSRRERVFDPLRSAAIVAGKTTASATRMLGLGGGTSLPGLVAERVHPGTARELAERVTEGFVVVTGTNGKTTTTKMLAGALTRDGHHVLTNESGSNLHRGITSSLVGRSDLLGRALGDADVAVLEVDEASVPGVMADVLPHMAVVTNFVRDQLDRYGEVDTIVRVVGEALAAHPGMTTVLNADDPYVYSLARYARGPVVFYGLDDPGVHNRRDPLLEAMYCPCCGHELDFAVRYFGHSGDWRCPNCALHRPGLDFAATDIALTPRSSSFRIRGAAESMPVRLPIPALYNVYNALAAATAARAAGASSSATGEELCDYRAAFGRMETLRVDGRDVMLLLSKNPVAARQALAAVMVDDRPKHLALALNDNFADGRDISWIWDVDFEDFDLSRCFVVATGTRAYDMAVRLKYAGCRRSGSASSPTSPARWRRSWRTCPRTSWDTRSPRTPR